MPKNPSLYEILGLSNKSPQSLTHADIRKSYLAIARKVHPDKQNKVKEQAEKGKKKSKKKTPVATQENDFIVIQLAYDVLSNPERKNLYDCTGQVEGEGSGFLASFDSRRIPKVTEEDLKSFSESYPHSEEEREDVIAHFRKFGDVSKILEYVPISTAGDCDRYIDIIRLYITNNSNVGSDATSASTEASKVDTDMIKTFESSIRKLKQNARKLKRLEVKEGKEMSTENGLNELAAVIESKKCNYDAVLNRLDHKYTKKEKNATKRKNALEENSRDTHTIVEEKKNGKKPRLENMIAEAAKTEESKLVMAPFDDSIPVIEDEKTDSSLKTNLAPKKNGKHARNRIAKTNPEIGNTGELPLDQPLEPTTTTKDAIQSLIIIKPTKKISSKERNSKFKENQSGNDISPPVDATLNIPTRKMRTKKTKN